MTGWTKEARAASARARAAKAHGHSPSASNKKPAGGKTLQQLREASLDRMRSPADRARISKSRADIQARVAKIAKAGGVKYVPPTGNGPKRGEGGYPKVDTSKTFTKKRTPSSPDSHTFHPIKNPLGGHSGRKLSRANQRRRIKASAAANQRALRANRRKRGVG